MKYPKGKKHWRYYREGYNNPTFFSTDSLLKSNDEISEAIISGICQRKADDQAGTTQFKRILFWEILNGHRTNKTVSQ